MPKIEPLLEVRPDTSFFPQGQEQVEAYKTYLDIGDVGPLNALGLMVRIETIYLNHQVHCITHINTSNLELAVFTKQKV